MSSVSDGSDPEVIGPRRKSDRSVAALLSDLANETIQLIRQEIALLKAELHEKLSRVGQGAAALAAGGLLALSGWLVLLAAAVLGLATVLPPWLAALIVGLVVLALGGGLLYLGKTRFAGDALLPRRTLNSLREDEAWIKDQMR
ncbi:MAG: phage holin family protein [Alphaproteobacteria bacterium]|nr:phage holin family protein [Alphaproteobacteria bacterium]